MSDKEKDSDRHKVDSKSRFHGIIDFNESDFEEDDDE